jgi:hypothetical protein
VRQELSTKAAPPAGETLEAEPPARLLLSTLVERAATVPGAYPPVLLPALEIEPEPEPEVALPPEPVVSAAEVSAEPGEPVEAASPAEQPVLQPLLQRIGAYTAKPTQLIVH